MVNPDYVKKQLEHIPSYPLSVSSVVFIWQTVSPGLMGPGQDCDQLTTEYWVVLSGGHLTEIPVCLAPSWMTSNFFFWQKFISSLDISRVLADFKVSIHMSIVHQTHWRHCQDGTWVMFTEIILCTQGWPHSSSQHRCVTQTQNVTKTNIGFIIQTYCEEYFWLRIASVL